MFAEDETQPSYRVWGADDLVYGPVSLPILVNWVKEGRVMAETWIFATHDNRWSPAEQVPELQLFFQSEAHRPSMSVDEAEGRGETLKPGILRRVKILSCLGETQLERFIEFMQVVRVRQWESIVAEGSPGDAMYLLLEGEVRVRMMIGGNADCLLLKVGAASVQQLVEQHPEVAAPFLFAVSRSLISRIRADNKRHREAIVFARSFGKEG